MAAARDRTGLRLVRSDSPPRLARRSMKLYAGTTEQFRADARMHLSMLIDQAELNDRTTRRSRGATDGGASNPPTSTA